MKRFRTLSTVIMVNCLSFSAAEGAQLSEMTWSEVVSRAKNEATVNFNVWYLKPQWRSFVKEFEQEYGIKVIIPESTVDGNLNKILAEKSKKTGKLDVIGFTMSQMPVVLNSQTVSPLAWLPEYQNGYGQLQGTNFLGYGLAFWGNQTGLAYDPLQMQNKKLPQTLEELQEFIDNNPNLFGYNDPQNGGAGEAFIQRVLTLQGQAEHKLADKTDPAVLQQWNKGWEWFIRNKSKITLTKSQADSLTRINDGELILAPAWEDHLLTLKKTGAVTSRIKFYVPGFGMPAGANAVVIAKNSAHPAASALFVNWLVSEKTQSELKNVFGSIPVNKKMNNEFDDKFQRVIFYNAPYSVELKKEFSSRVLLGR
ncbi:extracellular solute-binding protein [Pantoea sp. PNT01]|uniref:ABC transporter substrate-binding protein n=1 Tax=Pantoea TaxID=53335 RepID=UPI001780924E|nr:extracellular solute-binding protein [Pantoea sp. PNT01]MBD9552952.1 extracellular solute-binding protein [Pantoea sp. PNT01]